MAIFDPEYDDHNSSIDKEQRVLFHMILQELCYGITFIMIYRGSTSYNFNSIGSKCGQTDGVLILILRLTAGIATDPARVYS
jgi:hypothetical protein